MDRYDALVIGAGMGGMYQLHLLRKLGMKAKVLDAGADVGGTWYWHTYPGCRFDSETESYCFSFSPEILQEWNWTEHYASQPETLKYLNYVADTLDLRRDIQFNCLVTSARFDESKNIWEVTTRDGQTYRATFLITAMGALSVPVIPPFKDRDQFEGPNFHTYNWPREPLDLTGKRVAVIGTSSTGVQVIQEAAKVAGQLTVFQKEASWMKPLRNSPITPEEMEQIKLDYPKIFAKCKTTQAAFIYEYDKRSFYDVSEDEREQLMEDLYQKPGFAFWFSSFAEIATDLNAAKMVGDFLARKVRERVKNPAVADILIPKDHPFGTRRPPLETDYFEVYNQPNVRLIDVNATPIERFAKGGIKLENEELPFDVVIYATGFDAMRGAFDRIDFRGTAGQSLKDKWADGPVTFMGLQPHGFPNLFTVGGPQSGATFCNFPRCLEQSVEYVTGMLEYMQKNGYGRCEATVEAEKAWDKSVHEQAEYLLFTKIDGWFNGINTNIPGREKKRQLLMYPGGNVQWQALCQDMAVKNYAGIEMAKSGAGSDRQEAGAI